MICDFCGNNCSGYSYIDCTEEWITIVTGGRLEAWKFPESKYLGAPMKEVVICEICRGKIAEGKSV